MEPMESSNDIRLTQYSHGAGCGCKIAPAVLHNMLDGMKPGPSFPSLLVGNDTKDDAAVVDLGDGTGIISTRRSRTSRSTRSSGSNRRGHYR